MNIQQLSPDKLRVQLEVSDLEKYELDYFSISSQSPGTKRLLKEILSQAQKSGFSAFRCKILIEVLPGKNNGCVLYLTKTPFAAGSRVRRHHTDSICKGYILSCSNLDDAIDALGRFKDYSDIPIKSSSLYCFEDMYYLVFLPVALGLDRERLVSLLASLSEYGNAESANSIRVAMLTEHGETILTDRAVESFIRYFH